MPVLFIVREESKETGNECDFLIMLQHIGAFHWVSRPEQPQDLSCLDDPACTHARDAL